MSVSGLHGRKKWGGKKAIRSPLDFLTMPHTHPHPTPYNDSIKPVWVIFRGMTDLLLQITHAFVPIGVEILIIGGSESRGWLILESGAQVSPKRYIQRLTQRSRGIILQASTN